MKNGRAVALAAGIWVIGLGWVWPGAGGVTVVRGAAAPTGDLNVQLAAALRAAGFTGTVEATLERRLGRPLDSRLVDLGRLLFFDNILGLHEDNSCAGCHSPAFAFGDSQSIAIGVQNNGIVGPDRTGPRNQRKAPPVTNSGFFPKLMLNGRFSALSGDPFDNSSGFAFPLPEGTTRFPPGDPDVRTLLAAQGHIPQTELVEMAGFTGATRNRLFDEAFHQFDDGLGTTLPRDRDQDGFLNEEIRRIVLDKLNRIDGYLSRFAEVFNAATIDDFKVTFGMVGQALAEFQLSLTFANAPIDRFARGEWSAMTIAQKRGALLFFGKARCSECHAVSGPSNEMFSDFQNHVLGVPQLAPVFGAGSGNVAFDGPNRDEDFGEEQVTGNAAGRYKFRTSPLRNVGAQPAFVHNGAFTRLEDAIRHHLDARQSALGYSASMAGVDADLTLRMGPLEPVLARLDPRVQEPTRLSPTEFKDVVEFVRDALLDPRAQRSHLCGLVPAVVPSGMPLAVFQGCQ